jgi:hypothetical protein
MKRFLTLSTSVLIAVCFFSMQGSLSSCQKETEIIRDTLVIRDTVVVRDTISICKPDTLKLTLQNANIDEIIYFGHNSHSHDESNAVPPELDAGAWTSNGQPINIRSMFKFNLSTIPASSKILKARLTLFGNPTPLNGDHITANYGTDNSFYIRRVSGSWTTTSNAIWTAQPATTTTDQILIPHTSAGISDVADVDVSKLVQEMVNTNNYGFQIQLKTEAVYNIRGFCSSRHPNAAKHPKLVVEYEKK